MTNDKIRALGIRTAKAYGLNTDKHFGTLTEIIDMTIEQVEARYTKKQQDLEHLFDDLGTLKWMGEDEAWDLAITAVRNKILKMHRGNTLSKDDIGMNKIPNTDETVDSTDGSNDTALDNTNNSQVGVVEANPLNQNEMSESSNTGNQELERNKPIVQHCPKCGALGPFKMERSPNGKTYCYNPAKMCKYYGPHKDFYKEASNV